MALVYFGAIASWAERCERDGKRFITFTTPYGGEYLHKSAHPLAKASELQALYNAFVQEVTQQGCKCFYVVVQLQRGATIRGFKQAVEKLGDRQIIAPDYFKEEV